MTPLFNDYETVLLAAELLAETHPELAGRLRQIPERHGMSPGATLGFRAALFAAYDRLRAPAGLNVVALADLREALAGDYPREHFDYELRALRESRQVTLHTHDGRHGPASVRLREGAVVEDGRTFIYLARIES